MENEFGENIPEEKVDELTKRIRALPRESIDELWYYVGFIASDREPGNKALRNIDLDAIKEDEEEAREKVKALLTESNLADVTDGLSREEGKQ